MNEDLRIVFMGTPEFAVESLDILVKNKYNIAGVVTAPDKPAGRGKQIQSSPVKDYAVRNKLHLLQPENLKDKGFISQLESLKADLQIVVAFRMMPEVVWKMPCMGTFNLHASLLPQYRGAAPINWAVINGEKETGVTTFFINNNIDTGNIILSEKIKINPDETAGELHDRLKSAGAELVLKTVRLIQKGDHTTVGQDSLTNNNIGLKPAPKIYKEDCKIEWNKGMHEIYDFVRGLSPYPAAYTELCSPEDEMLYLKIFRVSEKKSSQKIQHGVIDTDGESFLSISANDGYLFAEEIQQSGKKRLNIKDFLRGFKINSNWKIKIP